MIRRVFAFDISAPSRIGLGEPSVPGAPLDLLDARPRLPFNIPLDEPLESVSVLKDLGRPRRLVGPDREQSESLYIGRL